MLDRRGLPWSVRSSGIVTADRRLRDVRRARCAASRPPGRCRRRARLLVGHGQDRFRRRQPDPPRGQNMIEPAGYGAAVSFGPNTWNFRDIVGLMLDRQAAIVVRDEVELESFVRRCLADATYADELGAPGAIARCASSKARLTEQSPCWNNSSSVRSKPFPLQRALRQPEPSRRLVGIAT